MLQIVEFEQHYKDKLKLDKKRNISYNSINTKLTIYALDQVRCWGAYFHPGIGHYENFIPFNF